MSDEIERLRKEVAGLREWHRRDSAELRRLCEARDEARNALAVRMRERAVEDEHLAQVIADRDEARVERDALLARIENSPRATMDARGDGLGLCAMVKEDFPLLYAIRGKSVALVVLDG